MPYKDLRPHEDKIEKCNQMRQLMRNQLSRELGDRLLRIITIRDARDDYFLDKNIYRIFSVDLFEVRGHKQKLCVVYYPYQYKIRYNILIQLSKDINNHRLTRLRNYLLDSLEFVIVADGFSSSAENMAKKLNFRLLGTGCITSAMRGSFALSHYLGLIGKHVPLNCFVCGIEFNHEFTWLPSIDRYVCQKDWENIRNDVFSREKELKSMLTEVTR